jgi:hypothetical protein
MSSARKPSSSPSSDDDAPAFPLPLVTLQRALLSSASAASFSVAEVEDAVGLFRVLLALAAGVSLAAARADGLLPALGALAAINLLALVLVRWRFDLDDEHIDAPSIFFGAGVPAEAALFLAWITGHSIAVSVGYSPMTELAKAAIASRASEAAAAAVAAASAAAEQASAAAAAAAAAAVAGAAATAAAGSGDDVSSVEL